MSSFLGNLEDTTMEAENTVREEHIQSDTIKIKALIALANSAWAKGDIQTATFNCEQLVLLDPKNAAALRNLGVLYLQSGNKEHAAKIFDDAGVLYLQSGNKERAAKIFGDAYAIAPRNENIRENYINTLVSNSLDWSNSGNYSQAIEWIRKVLVLEPNHPGMRVNLANALELTGQRAELADFMPGVPATQLGQHLLIACMPKSGSTFLLAALRALTGWPEAHFAYAYMQNEQEIYLPNVLQVARDHTVTKIHCRATGPNTQILQAFDIRPIVLVRSFPDIVVSLSDFFDQGATVNTFFGDIWPTLDEQGKYDLIIDHVMPWYAGFYASWERAQRLGRLNCLFVIYREMVADKPAMVARIADFLGLHKTPEECAAAVSAVDGNAAGTRFNRGIVGRGTRTLSTEQIARLRRLVTIYRNVDLKRIGVADSDL